ncbi:hypothetical protein ACTFIZ_012215 [Dictyostelium cf. discoideum]
MFKLFRFPFLDDFNNNNNNNNISIVSQNIDKINVSSTSQIQAISVLSQKRSNAIISMCGKLPSDDILIRAIRNLDSNKLSLDGVSKLVSIHKLHSNEVILDKPEIWCLMIDEFPMIKHGLMFLNQSLNQLIPYHWFVKNYLQVSPSIVYSLSYFNSNGNSNSNSNSNSNINSNSNSNININSDSNSNNRNSNKIMKSNQQQFATTICSVDCGLNINKVNKSLYTG